MIYVFGYSKGGVGKTTQTVQLGTELERRGRRTLLIDGDPQESLATWASWRKQNPDLPMPTTVRLRAKEVYDQGKPLSEKYDDTIIDVGGHDSLGLRNALLLGERLILPMGITGLDASVLDDFIHLLDEATTFNRGLRVKVLINRVNPHASDEELREFVASRGLSCFRQIVRERRPYQKALTDGLTVEEYKPRTDAAAAIHEMGKLYDEIIEWANDPDGKASEPNPIVGDTAAPENE